MKSNLFKRVLLCIFDIAFVFVGAYFALKLIELDGVGAYFHNVFIYSLICAALTVVVFLFHHLYRSLWQYAGIEEFVKMVMAVLIIFVINMLVSIFSGILSDGERFIPIRWCIVFSLMQLFFTCSVRFIFRLVRYLRRGNYIIFDNKNKYLQEQVMIIGAGDAGQTLIREMRNSDKLVMNPVCLIDDDSEKINQYLEGVKIVGNRDDIPRMASRYNIDKIIIAMPSINASELSKIIFICQDTKCKIQTIPGVYQLIGESQMLNKIRDVEIEDLLGRDPIKVNFDEISQYLFEQVVLITGGGGSIGSELCRQVAKAKPKQLIIVDCYENNAYDIEQELIRGYPELDLVVLIASVRDAKKVDSIFEIYKPNIVFHAAAHKHVPLMETSPNEAIKNNVFGTLNVARASDKYGVKKFVMISTDKAVNPTNIMGASKRICEMIVQTMNKKSKTEFVATRFGNVLGSNGSVIPLFRKQIESGGPVTVTHRNIVRYFMTIPEAVSLVLQAGSYARGGEIFVLDMGQPVKIYDLAVNLIKLSGYTPGVDIKIKITGLRPGEKLYEEMLMKEEGLQETPNKLIHIGHPIDVDEETLFEDLNELYQAAYSESAEIKNLVKKLVDTYVIKENEE